MLGVFANLAYRISISAIVGAVVAGGLVYFSMERANQAGRSEFSIFAEQQNETNKALLQANEELASAMGAIEASRDSDLKELTAAVAELSANFDALERDETLEIQIAQIIDELAQLKVSLAFLTDEIKAMKPEGE